LLIETGINQHSIVNQQSEINNQKLAANPTHVATAAS
jgi:hypothetical protein